jgi:hypothetical protein
MVVAKVSIRFLSIFAHGLISRNRQCPGASAHCRRLSPASHFLSCTESDLSPFTPSTFTVIFRLPSAMLFHYNDDCELGLRLLSDTSTRSVCNLDLTMVPRQGSVPSYEVHALHRCGSHPPLYAFIFPWAGNERNLSRLFDRSLSEQSKHDYVSFHSLYRFVAVLCRN